MRGQLTAYSHTPLLGSQLTVGGAFATIERMAGSGDALERSLAELCEEMLRDVQNLRKTYHGYVEEARRLAGTAARS